MNLDENKQELKECQVALNFLDFPVNNAILALIRSHRTEAANLLRSLGLFPGQELMLMQLWNKDHQSQNSLGKTFRHDHSTVAKSVRRLEEAGLVTRSQSQEDKRVTIVSLTEAGQDLQGVVLKAWERLEKNTTNGLSEEEKSLFLKLVHKMVSNFDSCEHYIEKKHND
ncbi:MarR family winged helix-turn-helix transcriptional regulator [Paenibacillus sp. LHD-117]|uniref:MarR family winged helix-turn-helix transcriptional regulator n=1 Tax=Paenibacillus sp. LHD-117 TaxID=3071412 RepID=UPI0027DEBD71|nr:MarR family winged helix-turn-helix transcriptional regulator [Paenibacillus sp. LHD-117]MDQ6420463.1 MarR family winged helix-turn-helix transcriptional regulator [Paenibacillus sp. LHD-117]